MEELNGAIIFWLISLGLLVGGILKLIFGKRGVSTAVNIGGGVLCTLMIGIFSVKMQLSGSLLFAGIGTLAVLFLGNVFFAGEEEMHKREKNTI